jgi:hypothetical protein
MLQKIKTLLIPIGVPIWLVIFNYLTLIPIIVWPFVLYISIFMFDNPENLSLTFLFFILINSYPIVLIGSMILSFKLFKTTKKVAILLPSFLILIFICFIIWLIIKFNNMNVV